MDDSITMETADESRRAFQCQYHECGKSYTRKEFLTRHIASAHAEADVGRHQCNTCGKLFNRKDVLTRHVRNHLGDMSRSPSAPRARLDCLKTACEECRRRKIKCDGATPCSKCTMSGVQCNYGTRGTPGPKKGKKTAQGSVPPTLYLAPSGSLNPSGEPSMFGLAIAAVQSAGGQSVPPAASLRGGNTHVDLSSVVYENSRNSVQEFTSGVYQQSGHSGAFLQGESATHNVGAVFSASNDQSHSQSVYPQHVSPVSPMNYFNNFSCMEEIFKFDVDDYLRILDGKESLLAQGNPTSFDTLNDYGAVMAPDLTQAQARQDSLTSLGPVTPAAVHATPQSRGSSPKHVPPLTSGLHTRPSSPRLPDPSANWPTAWDPTQDGAVEQDLEVNEALGVPRFDEAIATSIKLGEQDRISILEMLRFAELKVETFHRFYVRLSRISLLTLSHFLQCYFDSLHPYIPWCHKASFEPGTTSGFLLGMMVSLGAQFSSISGAKTFSHTLGDVVHRAIGNIVVLDTKYTRDIQLWQTCVLWSFLRCSGVKRLMELTDVYRNSYVVPLEKMHAFDGVLPLPTEVDEPGLPVEVRWRIWRGWESRNRTGFACFLSDSECHLYLNKAPMITPRMLQAPLPCADQLWEASTAEEWAALWSNSSQRMPSTRACDALKYRSFALSSADPTNTSSFASTILVQTLHGALWNLRQGGDFAPTLLSAAYKELRRALISVGGGPNEYVTKTSTCPGSPVPWRLFVLAYHLMHISLRVPLTLFLEIGGKSSHDLAENALSEVVNQLRADEVAARELALHAAQCYRIASQTTCESTIETFALFHAGLALYTYAYAALQSSGASERSLLADRSHGKMHLDCSAPSALEVNWVQQGSGIPSVASVRLGAKDSHLEVLRLFMATLTGRRCWMIGAEFSRVFQSMLSRHGASV